MVPSGGRLKRVAGSVAIAALFAAGSIGAAALPASAQTATTNPTGSFTQKDPNTLGPGTQSSALPIIGAQTPNGPSQLSGGSGATGNNTYMGHIDQPVANVPLYPGATVAMSGWAVDQSAQGWAGFDQVAIYNGLMGQGGSQIGGGSVGLLRPDIARQHGAAAVSSGWSGIATIPRLGAGNQYQQLPINVYFHTPTKGWYYVPGSILGNTDQRVRNESYANGILQAPGSFYSSDFIPVPLYSSTETHGRSLNRMCGYASDTNAADGTANIQNVEIILDGDPANVLPAVDLGPANLTGCTGIEAPRGYAPDSGWNMTINETLYVPQLPVDGGPPTRCAANNCGKNAAQWPQGQHTYYVVATTKTGKVSTLTIPFRVPS